MTKDEDEAFEAMRQVLRTQKLMVNDHRNRFFGLRNLGKAMIAFHSDWRGNASRALNMAERVKPAGPYEIWPDFHT